MVFSDPSGSVSIQVKFRKPVVPGDTLVMEVEVKKFREKVGIAKITGSAFVDGQKVLEVKEFTCALVKEPWMERKGRLGRWFLLGEMLVIFLARP